MSNGNFLMLKDKKVLYFDFEEFVIQILEPDLVPFCMRNALTGGTDVKSLLSDVQLLKSYLGRRVLSLSRDNAKQIYAMFKIPQVNDIETRVDVALSQKGVSVQDSYWIKAEDSSICFDDVDIRKKHFKEIVEISLYGRYPTVTTNIMCPDLTTQGVFRKSWVRYEDGLYLLKSDKHSCNINTRMEVLASKILSCFSNKIDCVEYTGRYRHTKDGKLYVSKCKNFVTSDYSFVEAWELIEYCHRSGKSYQNEVLGYSPQASSIGVLDFVLSNTDRHTQNYGFYMDNATGKLAGLAPLFDFNCALVSDVYDKEVGDTLSQMFDTDATLKEIALAYNPYSRLVLDYKKFNDIKRRNKDFGKVFNNVLKRCEFLGII